MMSLIERGADQGVHAAVEDGEFLLEAFLDIYHTADYMSALCHQGSAWLYVDALAGLDRQVAGNGAGEAFYIGHPVAQRIIVIHAEAASEVEQLNLQAVLFEYLLELCGFLA